MLAATGRADTPCSWLRGVVRCPRRRRRLLAGLAWFAVHVLWPHYDPVIRLGATIPPPARAAGHA